jgi:Cd2+/Zn2+-exporting ATPase
MGRTQREIRSLFREAPKTALLLDAQGHEVSWPVDQLEAGMRLLIKPGEQFPVDAEVVKGATASDESNLTGEATPVDKEIGDTVLAGTMNLWGAVEALVLRPANQSALQRIIQLIKTAQHLKAPSQRFTDKFGTAYTYSVLGLSLAMFFVWWLALGHQPFVSTGTDKSAFYRAMTLLVVSSPCALVLSIPSAVLAAIAWSARRGILFRGGAAVENLAEVSVVAMDKTGTLTTGELQVERVESFPPGHEEEIARLAYALEKLSTHPLARAVTRYGKQRQLPMVSVSDVESVAGFGLQGRVDGEFVRLGKRDWLASGPPAAVIKAAPRTDAGFAEIWVAKDGLSGRIVLRDDLRPHARGVVEQLRQLGLRTVVLTGDRQATGDQLKTQLTVDEVRAELKPDEKVEIIRSFVEQGKRVAMIGDGVNDAPSLAAADVGVAMGARGSGCGAGTSRDRADARSIGKLSHRPATESACPADYPAEPGHFLGTVVLLVGCALLGLIR